MLQHEFDLRRQRSRSSCFWRGCWLGSVQFMSSQRLFSPAELSQLPRWAMLAFAVLCTHRAEQCIAALGDQSKKVISEAILLLERVASGESEVDEKDLKSHFLPH